MVPLKIELHWLLSAPCALMNRDDHGEAKSLMVGGVRRHRVSDAALKHAWRSADDHPHALGRAVEIGTRSRATIRKLIADPLVAEGFDQEHVIAVLEPFVDAIVGGKDDKDDKKDKEGGDAGQTAPSRVGGLAGALDRRNTVVLGPREVAEIDREARALLFETKDASRDDAKKAVADRIKALRLNLAQMAMGPGADAALTGRHVTGDLLTRMDSALNVAHMLTVHAGHTEADYKTATDDLLNMTDLGHQGAAYVGEPRLAGGVFYGYLSIDVATLIRNTTGGPVDAASRDDRALAAELTRRIVHLAATRPPRARLTQTANHVRADLALLELTTGTPCQRMSAFDTPCAPRVPEAARTLADHIAATDAIHGRQSLRAVASTVPVEIPHATPGTLSDLAETAAAAVLDAERVADAVPRITGRALPLWGDAA